jgi:hypothetical protein
MDHVFNCLVFALLHLVPDPLQAYQVHRFFPVICQELLKLSTEFEENSDEELGNVSCLVILEGAGKGNLKGSGARGEWLQLISEYSLKQKWFQNTGVKFCFIVIPY